MSPHERCPACGAAMLPDDPSGGKARCARCDTAIGVAERITTTPSAPGNARFAEGVGIGNPVVTPLWEEDEDLDWVTRLRRHQPARTVALAQVRWPATLLQFCGAMTILAGLANLSFAAAIAPAPDRYAAVFAFGTVALVFSLFGAFLIVAGSRMKALRTYRIVMASIILTFVVWGLCGVAIGIWPLMVLMDPKVKEHFDRQPGERR